MDEKKYFAKINVNLQMLINCARLKSVKLTDEWKDSSVRTHQSNKYCLGSDL